MSCGQRIFFPFDSPDGLLLQRPECEWVRLPLLIDPAWPPEVASCFWHISAPPSSTHSTLSALAIPANRDPTLRDAKIARPIQADSGQTSAFRSLPGPTQTHSVPRFQPPRLNRTVRPRFPPKCGPLDSRTQNAQHSEATSIAIFTQWGRTTMNPASSTSDPG